MNTKAFDSFFWAPTHMHKKYAVLDKKVGETPLQCLEQFRSMNPELSGVPLAYAGRLDPMASGKLLVLIGEECKVQERYHHLDKEYQFKVLFGISSDTADVLGIVKPCDTRVPSKEAINTALKKYTGNIVLPYPHYSSKTVQGKPLHTWALEGKLSEIDIPKKRSTVYELKLLRMETKTAQEAYDEASCKIETIPKVSDPRKALGNDFRRTGVRASWKRVLDIDPRATYTIAEFQCIATSGTYMRSLAEAIGTEVDTCALAFSIDRLKIGSYRNLLPFLGVWVKIYS